MISRVFFAVKKGIKAAISAVGYFFLGDLMLFFEKGGVKKMNLKADASSSGVAVLRFGPKYYAKNIALIRSKLPPNQIEAQLKCVMDLREEKARSPYALFQWLTKSPFFLAMANSEAMLLRKKNMAQFSSAELIQKAEVHHERFVNHLLKKMDHNKIDNELINEAVFNYIQNILLSPLIGDKELPLNATQLMSKVDVDINMFLAVIVPHFFAFRPDTREGKKKFQQICSIISEVMDDRNLLVDPLNRLKLASFFASTNLSKIIAVSFQYIFRSRLLYSKLMNEINSNSESMPFLHAFYLETLRWVAPMNLVLRYTAKGIHTADLTVPPNSLIVFDLKHTLSNPLYFKNPKEFNPQRFFENEYSLHHGILSPFGVGMRMCPAVGISEKLFKWIIIHTVKKIAPPQYSFYNLFNDFYKAWDRVPSDDLSYDVYVANKNEQKGNEENRIQFILNANITFYVNNMLGLDSDKLTAMLYQTTTYSFFTLISYRVECVNITHNISAIDEAKKFYDKTTSALEKNPFIQAMSYHWNTLMDKQIIISCLFKDDIQSDLTEQARATADTLNAISEGVFKHAGCMPFFNSRKEGKLNGYFSYVKPHHAKHYRFFQLVQSYMKPYDQDAVNYPEMMIDKDTDFVLSTPDTSPAAYRC